ncbi:MAG: glycosyltransferase family 2 protein [Bacteroidia bacterium]
MKLSVVIPIYNEENIIHELYQRLETSCLKITTEFELIFVNDGSKDNSLIRLIELSKAHKYAHYINLSRNFGHQIAVTAGLDICKGEKVVIIDGDLQDPPELIPELFAKMNEGFEVVYARRRSRKGESFFKKVTAKVFYKTLRNITQVDIPLDTGDFRIIDRKVVDALKRMPEQNKFLRGQISWIGFKQGEVLFDRDERKFGKSGYPLSKMLKFAMDGVTGFSDKPLALVTRMGLWVSLISFFVIIYALYSHFLLERTITGWTSMIISSMFIGGIQLLSIGIIGEYISRINSNVQNRPLYIIESTDIDK